MSVKAQDYAIKHEGATFTPEGKADLPTLAAIEEHNAALEAAELAVWATCPNRFVAYVSDATVTVTTWRGKPLGRITRRTIYRTNMGATIEAVSVLGNNGARYHGRYGCDNSQLVRLRKVSRKPKDKTPAPIDGQSYQASIGLKELHAFKSKWPCHGFPSSLARAVFHFEANGDLRDAEYMARNGTPLDQDTIDAMDGRALLALCSDAQAKVHPKHAADRGHK